MADNAEQMELYKVAFKGKSYTDYVVMRKVKSFEDVVRIVKGCWSWDLDIVSIEHKRKDGVSVVRAVITEV